MANKREKFIEDWAEEQALDDLGELADAKLPYPQEARLYDRLVMLHRQEAAVYWLGNKTDGENGTDLVNDCYVFIEDAEKEVGDIDKVPALFDVAFKAYKACKEIRALKEAAEKLTTKPQGKKAAKRQRKLTALLAQEAA